MFSGIQSDCAGQFFCKRLKFIDPFPLHNTVVWVKFRADYKIRTMKFIISLSTNNEKENSVTTTYDNILRRTIFMHL